jgi:hypothetical protein
MSLRRAVAGAVAAIGVGACAGHGPAVEVAPTFFELQEKSGQREAWLAYAMKRRLWIDGTFHERYPRETVYRYTFEEELDAREAASSVWAEMRDGNRLSDRYFEELDRVRSAGYLPEYVWYCLPREHWETPRGLRTREFAQWLNANLPEHVVITGASLSRAADGLHMVVGVAAHPPRRCVAPAEIQGR